MKNKGLIVIEDLSKFDWTLSVQETRRRDDCVTTPTANQDSEQIALFNKNHALKDEPW